MEEYVKSSAYIAIALAMALGSLGPSLAQGYLSAKACDNIGKYPESYANIYSIWLLAMGFIETAALYVLIICLLIFFIG